MVGSPPDDAIGPIEGNWNVEKRKPILISGSPKDFSMSITDTMKILVVDGHEESIACVKDVLETIGTTPDITADVAAAESMIEQGQYDLLIADASVIGARLVDLVSLLRRKNSLARLVVMSDAKEFEMAVGAMRTGATDFFTKPLKAEECETRLRRTLAAIMLDRRRDEKVERLESICKRLNTARLDVTNQIDTLCNDLVHAYQELADQISHVTTVTEFAAVIRQELDVEELLRSTLEYLLRKLGPMNAAVFLPASGEEFSLGAYINYDCPKEASDFLLDHLADVVAPKMVDETKILEFQNQDDLAEWIGEDAAWISDAHVLIFSCRHDNECLAIYMVWRDMNTPFGHETAKLMELLSEVFARQLAHVIHLHHRHVPDTDWPEFGDMDEEDQPGGMAA